MASNTINLGILSLGAVIQRTATQYRAIGWASPYWVGRHRCERREASVWLRYQVPRAWRVRGVMQMWRPSTAMLRRIFNDPETPRSVRCHVYAMLRYRRTRP